MSFFAKFGISVSLLLVSCTDSYTRKTSNEASQIIGELQSKHYDQALHLIHKALKTNPQDSMLWAMQE
jgi:Flp pilus assembly protein TadD